MSNGLTTYWPSRPIVLFDDNLEVMRRLDDHFADLIYIDPPFSTGIDFGEFSDKWDWGKEAENNIDFLRDKRPDLTKVINLAMTYHSPDMAAFLSFMAVRLWEMKRLLKDTGSIYLHCDDHASHYFKVMMDALFGKHNFRNEIIWCYKGMPGKSNKWQRKHDNILFYTKSNKYCFNTQRTEPTPESIKTFESAQRVGYLANHKRMMVTVYDRSKYEDAVRAGKIPSGMRESDVNENTGRPPMRDWWDDIKILGGPKNKERWNWPTQKPVALVERIILSSSNEGDMILDPFCGSGTTLEASHNLRRRALGIEINDKSPARERMKKLPINN